MAVAVHGGEIGFKKIIKMFDGLVAQLRIEQGEDDAKMEHCNTTFDEIDVKKKGLEDISDLELVIEDDKESIAMLTIEIEALDDGIRALDEEVEEASEIQKTEHERLVVHAL